ncbi:Fic family protein [Candidatus Saccharibacteria bacterium]|nr:Fic family protein [Candidatus Saccharibacteria bacterium]
MENLSRRLETETYGEASLSQELASERPGHRFQAAEQLIDFINANYRAVFERPEACRKYLLECDYEDFSGLLIDINALSRSLDPATHDFDGGQARLLGAELPGWENRQLLLERALEATKQILGRQAEASPEQLGDLAVLWGGTLTATHPFLNGNGRTSRALGLLINQGFDGTPSAAWRLQAAMSQEGRRFFANCPLGFPEVNRLLRSFLNQGRPQRPNSLRIEDSTANDNCQMETATEVINLFIETVVNPDDYVISVKDLNKSDVRVWGCAVDQQLSLNALYRLIFRNLSFSHTPLTPLERLAAEREARQDGLTTTEALAAKLETKRRRFEAAVEAGKLADLSQERAAQHISLSMDLV